MGADVTVAVQAAIPVGTNASANANPTTNSNPTTNANANAGPNVNDSGAVLSSPDKIVKEGAGGLGGLREAGGSRGGGGNAAVEVRLEDARAVIVRGEREGGVGEGGLRRVGFEIGEWVRGWEEREERTRRGS